jgi:hypothetical protein
MGTRNGSSLTLPTVALALGLLAIGSAFAVGQTADEKPYLDCRWQEQASVFGTGSYPSLDEALRVAFRDEEALSPTDLGDVIILEEAPTEVIVGVSDEAVAQVALRDGGYSVATYRVCAPSAPPETDPDGNVPPEASEDDGGR